MAFVRANQKIPDCGECLKETVWVKDPGPGVGPKGMTPPGTERMIHCLQTSTSWEKATGPCLGSQGVLGVDTRTTAVVMAVTWL